MKQSSKKRNRRREIIHAVLPLIMLPLVRAKVIRAEHLKSVEDLLPVFQRSLRQGIKKMRWGIAIEEEFIDEAVSLWKEGKKIKSIVLYASAVEQYANQICRTVLEAHGLDEQAATTIIRALNIDAKLSWLSTLVSKKEFPERLGRRLRSIFELRNAIVHFKAVTAHPDSNEDSFSKIENGLKSLGRMRLSNDFGKLQKGLWDVVLRKDPDIDLALKAADLMSSIRHDRA